MAKSARSSNVATNWQPDVIATCGERLGAWCLHLVTGLVTRPLRAGSTLGAHPLTLVTTLGTSPPTLSEHLSDYPLHLATALGSRPLN